MMDVEGAVWLITVLAAFAYPLWVEDRVTFGTVALSAIFALFGPFALLLYALGHKEAVANRNARRRRDQVEAEMRARGDWPNYP